MNRDADTTVQLAQRGHFMSHVKRERLQRCWLGRPNPQKLHLVIRRLNVLRASCLPLLDIALPVVRTSIRPLPIKPPLSLSAQPSRCAANLIDAHFSLRVRRFPKL